MFESKREWIECTTNCKFSNEPKMDLISTTKELLWETKRIARRRKGASAWVIQIKRPAQEPAFQTLKSSPQGDKQDSESCGWRLLLRHVWRCGSSLMNGTWRVHGNRNGETQELDQLVSDSSHVAQPCKNWKAEQEALACSITLKAHDYSAVRKWEGQQESIF